MNYGTLLLGRVLAVGAISVLLIGLQSAGVALQQRREMQLYERLGSAVCDEGKFDTTWWLWPPQVHLSGRYRGYRFQYQKTSGQSCHVLVKCVPVAAAETSVHHPHNFSSDISVSDLNRLFPGWIALYATRTPVPWLKRSLDRRPLGFGSAPGIDLYRQSGNAFDAALLQSDLEGLQSFCSE